METIKDKKTVS